MVVLELGKGKESNAGKEHMITKAYRNVTTKKISLKQDGLVVGHADKVVLRDATFTVNEAARKRVIKEKRKNVHATIDGTVVEVVGFKPYKDRDLKMPADTSHETPKRLNVYYNPYKTKHFMVEDKPIHEAPVVIIHSTGIVHI